MAARKSRKRPTQTEPALAEAPAREAHTPLASRPSPFWRLRIFVLVAGIILMAFEIVGSRVLAPHFGNSIFTWGSIITVFMTALALGYFLGGRLADKYPHTLSLAIIGLLAATIISLVPALSRPVCESIRRVNYGPRANPFFASMFLFFPASVLLGMVSPFAVRIASSDIASIGKTAGTLYALSTLGSIAGTILTSFFLIPAVGVRNIILALAVVMLVVSLLLATVPHRKLVPLVLLCVFTTSIGFATPEKVFHKGRLLFFKESHYQDVTVDEADRARYLYFDRYLESGVELAPPHNTACHYTDMLHLGLLFPPRIGSVLFIGGGGGVGPRRFRRDWPHIRIDVVEIDPVVVEISKRFFYFEEDDRLKAHVGDGRMWLDGHPDKYDLIILDAYSISGQVPFHLMTEEFFRLCRARLNPGGAILMNLITAVEGRESRLFHAEVKTFKQVFPNVYVFPRDYSRVEPTYAANCMIVASTRPERLTANQILKRAADMVDEKKITIPKFTIIAEACMHYVFEAAENPAYAAAPVLTDDFAPVELLQPKW